MQKNQFMAALAISMCALSARSAFAITIDNFDTPPGGTTLTQTGVGTTFSSLNEVAVLGGNRFERVTVDAAPGTGVATMKTNNLDAGRLAFNSDSQSTATFVVAYGTTADMNLNLAITENAFEIVLIAADLPSLNNSITVRSSSGTSTASFVIPGLVGYPGGTASPFTLAVPFSTFTGGASFNDVDGITFSFNAQAASDYTIGSFSTSGPVLGNVIPATPASIGGMGLVAVILLRRSLSRAT